MLCLWQTEQVAPHYNSSEKLCVWEEFIQQIALWNIASNKKHSICPCFLFAGLLMRNFKFHLMPINLVDFELILHQCLNTKILHSESLEKSKNGMCELSNFVFSISKSISSCPKCFKTVFSSATKRLVVQFLVVLNIGHNSFYPLRPT